MRTVTVSVAVVLSSLLTTSIALAEGPATAKTKKGKKAEPVLVAAADPLPQLPPAEAPAPAAEAAPSIVVEAPRASADKSATAPKKGDPPSAGPGFVLVLGSGLGFLGGKAAEGIDVSAGLVTFDLQLGAYVSQHVGIMAGVRGGYGALIDGCAGSCTKAFAYHLPVVVQYALKDRSRGAYFEGGLALFTTYGGSTDTASGDSPETLKVSAPIDLKLGAGYRIPMNATPEKAATTAFDLRFGVDLGQFKSLEYGSVAGSVKGDVLSERQAMHFALGLSAGYHFSP